MSTNTTTPPLRALIFDVDGTLADTERNGHLPASNEAFKTLNLPIHWSWEDFKQLLSLASRGSAQRARHALTSHTDLSEAEIESLIPRFVERKQQLYIEKYLPDLTLRPGVERIVSEAVRRGVRLAIVSTSYEQQIHALLRSRLGKFHSQFNPVLGKESGTKTGPSGCLYERCLENLGCPPESALAIEDSEVGLKAARKAGIPCAVFYNDYTFGENFAGARLVAKSLDLFDLEKLVQATRSANG